MLRSQAELAAENEAMLWVLGAIVLLWILGYPAIWLHRRRMKKLSICPWCRGHKSPWDRVCAHCGSESGMSLREFDKREGH